MKIYVFADKGALARTGSDDAGLRDVMERIAGDTDTQDLVVALYLFRNKTSWEAHAGGETIGPEKFANVRGYWRFVSRFGTPTDLPERFQLIRIELGLRTKYPVTETDIYGWEMTFEAFRDHLAYTFAHELHHFRGDHLEMHAGEGEQSATKWALVRVHDAGFHVSGLRLPVRKRRRPKKRILRLPRDHRPELLRRIKLSTSHLCADDLKELERWIRRRLSTVRRQSKQGRLDAHFAKLRSLPEGAAVCIIKDDDEHGYTGQTATKVRSLKRGSPRMLVRTPDGEEWHWPMEWLELPSPGVADPQQTLFPENR